MGERIVRANALLDTGAQKSAVPLWALDAIGMIPKDGTKSRVMSAAGWVDAYAATVGMEIQYGGKWFDMGAVGAFSLNTEWSRSPDMRVPFLLGRTGFFDRFEMRINELERAAWLRKIGR